MDKACNYPPRPTWVLQLINVDRSCTHERHYLIVWMATCSRAPGCYEQPGSAYGKSPAQNGAELTVLQMLKSMLLTFSMLKAASRLIHICGIGYDVVVRDSKQ